MLPKLLFTSRAFSCWSGLSRLRVSKWPATALPKTMAKTNMIRMIITKAHMRQVKEFSSANTMVRKLFNALMNRTTRTTRTTRKTRKIRRNEKFEVTGSSNSTREFKTKKKSKQFHLQSSLPVKNFFPSVAARSTNSRANHTVNAMSGSFQSGSLGKPWMRRKLFFTWWSAATPIQTVFTAMTIMQNALKTKLCTMVSMIEPFRPEVENTLSLKT
mmetsp:Transcript_59863/g.165629  ORF Transcript_59863/g.165629 Transcript_59863/m.165629 type:complete len:215 (+) Transcript_59863:758-1402(+)